MYYTDNLKNFVWNYLYFLSAEPRAKGAGEAKVLRNLRMWSILEKVRTHFQENPADDFWKITLGRAKRKGVGGKEFLPALAFVASFFADAIFLHFALRNVVIYYF